MKNCPYCGSSNLDDATMCFECGSMLETSQPTANQKKSGGGKLLGILAGVLAAGAVLALGVWGGSHLFSGDNQVKRGFEKTGDAFMAQIEKQEDMGNFIAQMESLAEDNAYSLQVTAFNEGRETTVSLEYSQPSKALSGEVSIENAGLATEIDFYCKKDNLQLRLPFLSNDVYGFSLQDLEKKYEGSFLANIFGKDLGKKLPTDLFAKKSGTLKQDAVWKQLWKLAKIDKQDDQGDTKVYTVEWSAKNLEKIGKSAANNKVLKAVVTLLEKSGTGLTCYMEDGCVLKVEIVIAGDMYTAKLEGPEDNPWERISVKSSIHPDWEIHGGVTTEENQVVVLLENDTDVILSFTYHQADGAFTLEGPAYLTGTMTSDGNATRLAIREDDETYITAQIRDLRTTPDGLAKKYVDILDMSAAQTAKLVVQMTEQQEVLQVISELIGDAISFLG